MRTTRLLALLVVAGLLAGCAGEPEADGNETTNATPSASVTTPTTASTPTGVTPVGVTPSPTTTPQPLPGTNATATDAGAVRPMLEGAYTARIEKSMGVILLELQEDKAPLHVANFLQYAEEGLYDGTVFHRIVQNPAVIQGGGFGAPFTGQASKRPTEWGPIPLEIPEGNEHLEGTLGMARTNVPDSATSQWFINTARNAFLDTGYTVFGTVTDGMDVVKAISGVAVEDRPYAQDVPVDDVIIEKVTVTTPDAPPHPNLAAYTESVGLAPGGKVSIPVQVKNIGGGRLNATFAATATGGATATLLLQPGPQSPGHAGVAIIEVNAPESFPGGDLVIEARDGDESEAIRVTLRKLDATGNAAGPQHPLVSTFYVGIYDNGVVFDTTRTDLADRGFSLPSAFRAHPDPLQVYVGAAQTSPDPDYTPVIPGFASGIVGLRGGETRTVRLTSDEGYRDGYYRIFEMDVASVDS